jgi:glycosyltransferase involved in cell wall biosynthesis
MHKKTILFIGHLWPEPTSSAAGYRTLALLQALQKEPDWHIYFSSAADKTEFCANLAQRGIISQPIKLNDSSFDDFILSIKPDIVIYDRFISEEQFAPRVQAHFPEAINILDTQDLHFLRRARQKALKTAQALDLYSDDCVREIGAILRCDLSLIISTYEVQLLIETFNISAEILLYCPFMLALKTESNTPVQKSYELREHFVMIGNFLHPPNWDAVLWCYQSIWPLIRKQFPEAQVHVYGAYPSEKVWQLHQPDKGFFIMGRADNAIETLGQYRINLAPLRFGAGIKGKIADGWLAGTPCISTVIGQEGMCLPDQNGPSSWGGLIADTPEHIAETAIKLYQDKTLWQQCQHNGEQIIRQQFDEVPHTQAFIKTIKELIANLSAHRKQNFYGKILRHNLYRSQYFMSKWIEGKNTLKNEQS